jgi:hypothetical protein
MGIVFGNVHDMIPQLRLALSVNNVRIWPNSSTQELITWVNVLNSTK